MIQEEYKKCLQENISHVEREKTKKYSIIDGSAWSVMYGFGEQYVTPFALRLGASDSQIGVLSSIPSFAGSLFQILGARLTDKYKCRKKIIFWFVLLQAIILLPMFLLPLLTHNILVLTFLFSLYMVFGNIVGPSWNSLIGEIVEENDRSRYFALRNKITISVLLLSVLAAGIVLNYFTDKNIGVGFGILFSTAFLGRIASAYFISKHFEPKYVTKEESYFSLREFLKKIPETNFGNFVIFRSLIAFSVMIASPFFAVFMLKNLEFSYIQFTTVILVPMIAKFLTMQYWGKYSEKFGNKRIMFVSGYLIALIPLAWILAWLFAGKDIFYWIIAAEFLSGFAWAGFELTTFNFILETVRPEKRARAVAYFNVVFGSAVLIGGMLGAFLVKKATDINILNISIPALIIVFAISAAVRFIVPLLFTGKLRDVRIDKSISERELFYNLVIATPFNAALHQTALTMEQTEDMIKIMKKNTKNALKNIAEPIKPLIRQIVDRLDEKLEKAETLRKKLEPELIRKHKKSIHTHMTRHFKHISIKKQKEK